ncbi:MAG: hypothetical protein ACR2GJ_09810 [Gemmatimonadaceae bacterium]
MRKSFLTAALLFAAVGCAATPSPAITPSPGSVAAPAAARLAVTAFLDAVRAEDIQAMGAIFGTSRGPLRETMPSADAGQLEKRLIILHCYLQHDSYRVLSEVPGEGASRIVRVELTRGRNRRQPALFAVEGPRGRWYVENVELAAVRDFCGM